jgi:hypothetical protein
MPLAGGMVPSSWRATIRLSVHGVEVRVGTTGASERLRSRPEGIARYVFQISSMPAVSKASWDRGDGCCE